jgi:hypothetical protein
MLGNELTPLARRTARRVLAMPMLCRLGALGLGAVTVVATGSATAASAPPLGVITSAAVVFNLTVSVPGHYVTTVRGNGQIDFTHHDVTMSLTLPVTGLHSNQRVNGKKAVALSGPLQLKGQWIAGAAYVTMPVSLASNIGGAPTASYPVPTSLADDFDTSISQTAVAITYAHLLLDTLVGQHTRDAGHKTMDRARVSGTSVNLTLSELLKIVPALGPIMGTTLAPMAHLSIPVTIWTDSRGRLVQATFTQPKSAVTGLSGTVHFSDFNGPVTMTAPAAGSSHPISKSELAFLRAQNPFGGGG